MRSAPVLVLVFAIIFLKEQVSFLGFLGILTVVLGVYIINMKKITLSELLEPIKSVLKDRTTQFAFLTLISIALYSVVNKVGVSYVHPIMFAYLFTFFGLIFFTPYILYFKDKISIVNEWKINNKAILINGFLAIFGYSLILIAFTIGRVSYISGLQQLSIIFAVFFGSRFLKEKHKLIRFSAATLIFIGAFLISIAK